MFWLNKKPYKIGVALSGGGARGLAHLGALYAMDELGIKPDIIAGVSAGSIAAAMYGAGLSPIEIYKLFLKVKVSDFCGIAVPKDGFLRMDGFKEFLETNLPVRNIEECPTPIAICATDIYNAVPVQWRQGKIAERVMASCSLPIVFKPVKIGGVSYVDGGVLHNLPAWAIRSECEHVIGVNVSPLSTIDEMSSSIIDIAMRSYHLMARANALADMKLCDTVISTDSISDINVFDMHDKDKMFKSGYKAAKKALLESKLCK
ncbi:MAG: patatin-like phospholipase family protein [Muribaculum sp.]|nr:patatin-like phospholipase family protein [Muribaculum sp.]